MTWRGVFLCAALAATGCDGCNQPDEPQGDDTGWEPVECEDGYLDDRGSCVPQACGVGDWGDIELTADAVFVDAAAADGGDGSQEAPFTNIQQGLDAGTGMVAVAAGTYVENLTLGDAQDGVILAGRCFEMVTVDGSGSSDHEATILAEGAAESGWTVSGLSVTGGAEYGVSLMSGALSLSDCDVYENYKRGVGAAYSESALSLRSVAIRDIATDPDGSTVGGWYGRGLQAFDGAEVVAEDVQIEGCTTVSVLVSGSGTSLSLDGGSVNGTSADPDGQLGMGVMVQGDASFTGSGLDITGSHVSGAVANGGTMNLTDVVITDTAAGMDSFARGLWAYGADLTVQDVEVHDTEGLGVSGSAGSTIQGAGLTVTGSRMWESADGYFAAGVALYGGSVVELAQVSIDDCDIYGLWGFEKGTDAHITELSVTNTVGLSEVGAATAVVASQGAALDLSDTELLDNDGAGITVIEAGSTITVEDLTVTGTSAGDVGAGATINVGEGGTFSGSAVVISDNQGSGLASMGAGSTLILSSCTVSNTLPNDETIILDPSVGGSAMEGGRLELTDCAISETDGAGVIAQEAGSVAVLVDATIEDTQGSDGFGYGVEAAAGGAVEITRGSIERASTIGLVITGEGSSATVSGLTISDTLSSGEKDLGYGIQVNDGGALVASELTITGSTQAGIAVLDEGSSVTVTGGSVSTTAGSQYYVAATGVVAQDGGVFEASDFDVSDSEGPGLYAMNRGELACDACTVSGSQFAGVAAQYGGVLGLEDVEVEHTDAHADLGCGLGVFLSNTTTLGPEATLDGVTVAEQALAGLWIQGVGTYQILDSSFAGGEGLLDGDRQYHGDAVYVTGGVPAWGDEGEWGLDLQGCTLHDSARAGLLLDGSSAALSGNVYADNGVDLILQGDGCDSPPAGSDEASTVESCPEYDYYTSTCELDLVVEAADAEQGR